jgi:DNA-binding response OmpR family regulator
MTKKIRILYIEDEPSLAKIVHDTLEHQGFDIKWEADGTKIIDTLRSFEPDICILDIMLPNIDGYQLCKTIKGISPSLPVIFLTAKTETKDLIEGFEAGATDYIKKPFSIEELIARIRNQLKTGSRLQTGNATVMEIRIGSVLFIPSRYELQTDGGNIKLSNRDMEILKILYANRNRVTPRKDLLLTVWGDDSYFNSRTLDVYIRKLRNHFSCDRSVQIITLKGSGYMFLVP